MASGLKASDDRPWKERVQSTWPSSSESGSDSSSRPSDRERRGGDGSLDADWVVVAVCGIGVRGVCWVGRGAAAAVAGSCW